MAQKLFADDSFYENLNLGLCSLLADIPRICDIMCEKREPCEKAQVLTWEQRHGVYLPEDMKKFYLSTDGFHLRWSYQYSLQETRRVGFIYFPHLVQIILLRENAETNFMSPISDIISLKSSNASLGSNHTITYKSVNTSSDLSVHSLANKAEFIMKDSWGNPLPAIGPKTKIFEINLVNGVAKVCLLYEMTGSNSPKIYLLELKSKKWVFLADTFTEYLRMSIMHLGLPFWQLCFASCGLPSWVEQLFLLVAPHLLYVPELRRRHHIEHDFEPIQNILNPNIFRIKYKTSTVKNYSNVKF